MTRLALNLSEHVNGVARRHAEVSRRMTPYKGADLLFSDLERLEEIARHRPFQIVLAGKS